MAKIVKLHTERDAKVNVLTCELDEKLYENPINREFVFDCFYRFLYAAKVDSTIIVDVLSKYKDECAQQMVLEIKITEGW